MICWAQRKGRGNRITERAQACVRVEKDNESRSGFLEGREGRTGQRAEMLFRVLLPLFRLVILSWLMFVHAGFGVGVDVVEKNKKIND